MHKKKRKVFLWILAISLWVAILGLVIPVGPGLFPEDRLEQNADGQNLRTIAIGRFEYCRKDGNYQMIEVERLDEFAAKLAHHTGHNNARIYFSITDEQLQAQIPDVILNDINDVSTVNRQFVELSSLSAWTIVVGIPQNAPLSTTPIGWSCGFHWINEYPDAEMSPHTYEGVLIAFADGHVTYYESLSEDGVGVFVKYGTNERTGNLLEALPPPYEHNGETYPKLINPGDEIVPPKKSRWKRITSWFD